MSDSGRSSHKMNQTSNLADEPPLPLSSIVLTDEEKRLFSSEFLNEAISRAMMGVREFENIRSRRISSVLAMRDLLFAEWVRDRLGSVEDVDGRVRKFQAIDTYVPERAAVYQRVNRFAEARNIAVEDYRRFVDAFERLSQPISESTTDDELDALFGLVGASTG